MLLFYILVLGVVSVSAEPQYSVRNSKIIAPSLTEEEFQSLYLPEAYNINPNTNPPTGGDIDDYVKRVPLSSQALARILSLGIQNKLTTKLPEIERPPLSARGVQVVQQLAEALYVLWYQPVMVLVDNTEAVHHDANIFMRNILSLSQIKADFRLMKFNNSDVSPILANTSEGRDNFLEYLQWKENSNTTKTTQLLVPEALQGSVVFYAVLKATKLLPEETGIIVFTDRQVEDEDLAQLAVKELLDKNIKLYVIWEGIYPTIKNEEKLLREAALITGGDFLVGNTERKLSELYSNAYVTHVDAMLTKAVIAIYSNITEPEQRRFPIDSGVTSIHISITSPVASVRLISPKGFSLDVLNKTAVESFSEGSFSTNDVLGRYEIQLNTAGNVPTPIVGIWRLDVDGGGLHAQGSNVIVSVQSRLNVTTYIGYKFEDDANPESDIPKTKKVLKVALSGNFNEIDNISVLDEWGSPIIQNINFTSKYKKKEPLTAMDDSIHPKQEVDIDFSQLPQGSFYLKIWGEDKDGRAFARLSYFDREKVNYLVQPLSVDVGAGSELLVRPNQFGKVFFEVTNNRDQVIYVHFRVQDERSLLSQMQPRASWINPKQTIIVTVTTYAPHAMSAGYRNLITFTVSGPERVQKSAAMYVSTNIITDNKEPRLTHRYTSDCTDILLGNCQDGTWIIEVTAEDRESGLLQLTSNPKGLYFPNGYIAGTKEPVVGLYGGSCCQPRIQLTAIDMQNNRRSYTADAYYATLSAGSISAIILGIILFIIIVVAIVCICRIKCCKSKESVDLPTYRGPHGSQSSCFSSSARKIKF